MLRFGSAATALLVLLVLSMPSGPPPSAQKPGSTLGPGPKVTIEMIGQGNPAHLQYTKVEAPYIKEILPQRSNRRLDIKLSTRDERNLQGTELVRLLRQGQVDISNVSLTFIAGDVRILDGVDLAGLNPTAEQARKVTNAMTATFNKELERFGVKQISAYPYPSQAFYCRQPIKSLDDLKGRKIRTFGVTLNDLVVALGAQPVSMAFPEVYSALERGVVDCGITGTATGNASKWYEVTTHLYTYPLSWGVNAYFVNLAWWNKLDPDVRQFLEASLVEMADKLSELTVEITQDGTDCNTGRSTCKHGTLAKDRPMVEVKATDAEKARFNRILEETVIPAWVKRCGDPCGETYNQIIAPITGVKYTKR
ncbi:MAG TPA: TRAP transporter substrate-binding protein [Methylomirabilota bacterium]|jgi:TRAP-type C4-dicarboxylate transport system substrate-binding protein|nr:TRAP transporter substrate-binding protein [Methylomirabilota bacterium]